MIFSGFSRHAKITSGSSQQELILEYTHHLGAKSHRSPYLERNPTAFEDLFSLGLHSKYPPTLVTHEGIPFRHDPDTRTLYVQSVQNWLTALKSFGSIDTPHFFLLEKVAARFIQDNTKFTPPIHDPGPLTHGQRLWNIIDMDLHERLASHGSRWRLYDTVLCLDSHLDDDQLLLDHAFEQLEIPRFYQRTWEGLFEALDDFSWVAKDALAISHRGPLFEDNPTRQHAYKACLGRLHRTFFLDPHRRCDLFFDTSSQQCAPIPPTHDDSFWLKRLVTGYRHTLTKESHWDVSNLGFIPDGM